MKSLTTTLMTGLLLFSSVQALAASSIAGVYGGSLESSGHTLGVKLTVAQASPQSLTGTFGINAGLAAADLAMPNLKYNTKSGILTGSGKGSIVGRPLAISLTCHNRGQFESLACTSVDRDNVVSHFTLTRLN